MTGSVVEGAAEALVSDNSSPVEGSAAAFSGILARFDGVVRSSVRDASSLSDPGNEGVASEHGEASAHTETRSPHRDKRVTPCATMERRLFNVVAGGAAGDANAELIEGSL